jgi:hypothetical protein
MTLALRLVPVLAALAFAAAGPLAAQQGVPPGLPHGLPPGIPPSVGQEIDRALQQVPSGARGRAGAPSVGAEVDALISRHGASRSVKLEFVNKAPHKALVIQFAPVGSGEWGTNRLRRETLNPNAIMSWRQTGTECRYDVRITFALGNEFVRLGHDFCAQERLEVTAADAEPAALPRRDQVALFRVINRSNATVAVLRVTPAGARQPKPDLLGIWMMENGDSYTGRVPRAANCLYDIRVGFNPEDTQTATISRQNLCETPEIVVPARTAGG